jgi:hypothetical protein
MLTAKQELEALWAAVFHEPPVIDADPSLLAEMIVRCCGPLPPYGAAPLPPAHVQEPTASPPDDTSAPCDR